MPKYSYTAKNLQNKIVHDTVEARDIKDLKRRVRELDLVLIDVSDQQEDPARNYRLKANELAEFSRQLADMLATGTTVIRAMDIILDGTTKPALKSIINHLHRDVQGGLTLSEAMSQQKRAFPELFVNMYASGEASGQLEQAARKMYVHYEKEFRLNRKVRGAMFYPIFLFVLTIIVVFAIFIFILPQFFTLFEDIELPLITQAVIGISKFLQNFWHVFLIGVLMLFAFIRYLLKIPKFNLWANQKKTRIPVIGKLVKIIYTARFSRTLCSLYTGGLSMLNALEISSKVLGNSYIESQFDEVISKVRNGDPLSESVNIIDGFNKKLPANIRIGEESGRLDSVLESMADSFDYEAEIATQALVSLIGPVMIIFMAVIICLVMLSVMLPILTLYQNIA